MSTRKILIWPNRDLFKVSDPVVEDQIETEEFKRLIRDLFFMMRAGSGIGLSAIQVGEPLRVFVMASPAASPLVIVNPEIKERFDEPILVKEGCLSLPGVQEEVLRHPEIVATFRNIEFTEETQQFSGLEAQIFQHELEHLDGKIFVNPGGVAKRDILRRKIQKTLRDARR